MIILFLHEKTETWDVEQITKVAEPYLNFRSACLCILSLHQTSYTICCLNISIKLLGRITSLLIKKWSAGTMPSEFTLPTDRNRLSHSPVSLPWFLGVLEHWRVSDIEVLFEFLKWYAALREKTGGDAFQRTSAFSLKDLVAP